LKLKNVAFLTTIFPMKEQFLIDFFDSLSRQTYKFFDVVVVNDGYCNLNDLKSKYDMLNIVELAYSSTPAKNREYGINYCIENKYDVLVFGDSDDYFSDNRVELLLSALNDNDIIVNDVSLFDDNGVYEDMYMSNRLKNDSNVGYDYIQNKNIFGLSNTALKTNVLNKVTFDQNLIAVDWCLYKGLLKNGCNAVFTNKAITYYRQYKNNTVGLQAIKGKYYLWWEKRNEEIN
jgi:glycosyltransferase involved in cell wall biosynthesis